MAGNTVVESSKEPSLVEEFSGISTAACGSSHSAFVMDGRLYTYGSNQYMQLGRSAGEGSEQGVGAPAAAVEFKAAGEGGASRVVSVALGAQHSAAVTDDGALWTWGWGGSFWSGAGGLGQGTRDSREEPTLVPTFQETGEVIRQVACGSQHTIVLTTEGRLYATGKGDFGRLGRGDTQDELDFEEIEYFSQANDSVLNPVGEPKIVKVDAGNNFTAALSSDGELWVWGRNDHGQLGLGEEGMGDMYSAERYPRLVRALPLEGQQVVDFACGEFHLVALTSAGALYEWGNRTWLEPHPVSLPARYKDGLKDIKMVAAGDKVSFAVTHSGQLYSWGAKSSGCLAQGPNCANNIVEPTLVPAEVFGHHKILEVHAANKRCLAITQEDVFVGDAAK